MKTEQQQASCGSEEKEEGSGAKVKFQNASEGTGKKQDKYQQFSTKLVLENQYFMKDSISDEEVHQNITLEQFYKLQKYGNHWSWAQFAEFFGYHFVKKLFVFLLGPLAPFVLIKFTGKTILYNMCFLGRERPVAVASSIYFLSYLFTVSHAIVPSQNSITAEVVIMWLLLFFRCVTYAAKYGSFPREKVRLYKRQRVPFRDAMADSFLYYYDSQTKHVVYSESWHAFRSHEFEPSMFYLDFFLMPSQEIAEELNQLALDLAEEHRLPEEYQPEPLFPGLTCSFYGFGLLAKFIREFEAEHPRRNLACLGIVVAFLLSVFPLIFRVAGGDGGRWHPDVSPVSILRMIVLILLNTYLSSEALLFLMVGIRDLQRRLFLVIQCAHIISPRRKDHYLERKVLPTINIISPASIKAWSMLRQVCLTYGSQFHARTRVYFSLAIVVQIVAIVFLLLFLFNIVHVQLISALFVAVWTIVFFLLLAAMLLVSAEINSYFEEYRNLLEELNSLFQDVQRMSKHYFQEGVGKKFEIQSFLKVPSSFLHRKFVEQLAAVNELEKRMECIGTYIDDARRNLEFDARNNQIEFLQIPVTYELLGKVAVSTGTLFGFAVQSWIQAQRSQTTL